MRDFDEGDDDDDDDDILRCERIFLRIFHLLSTFYLRKTIIERTSLKPHKDDDDTEHVPGVLPSSSRGENGIIIIDIIIIDILIAGLSSASLLDEKK